MRPDEPVFVPGGTTETLDEDCAKKHPAEHFRVFTLDTREGVVVTDQEIRESVTNDVAQNDQKRRPVGPGKR